MELDPSHAFSSFVCESLRNNCIDLAISCPALLLVFKYISTSVFCAMRLTKRDDNEPILRFEFNFLDAGNCLVVHDIPVEVLRPEFAWAQPVLPDPEARLLVSSSHIKKIIQYLDRARQMGVSDVTLEICSANLALIGVCESVKAALSINNLPSQNTTTTTEENLLVSVHLTLTGISFALTKLLSITPACRCVLMASGSKYLSAFIQLPNHYGSFAAITPAIMID
jgi:hypothetical protein